MLKGLNRTVIVGDYCCRETVNSLNSSPQALARLCLPVQVLDLQALS